MPHGSEVSESEADSHDEAPVTRWPGHCLLPGAAPYRQRFRSRAIPAPRVRPGRPNRRRWYPCLGSSLNQRSSPSFKIVPGQPSPLGGWLALLPAATTAVTPDSTRYPRGRRSLTRSTSPGSRASWFSSTLPASCPRRSASKGQGSLGCRIDLRYPTCLSSALPPVWSWGSSWPGARLPIRPQWSPHRRLRRRLPP